MTPFEILCEVDNRFIYRKDGKIDNWRVHRHGGIIFGDCEDYALTLLWELSGRSWIKFWWNQIRGRATIWHVKSYQGNGHAVLRWKDRYADNMESYWYPLSNMRHTRRFPWLWPFVALKMLIGAILRKF